MRKNYSAAGDNKYKYIMTLIELCINMKLNCCQLKLLHLH